MHHASPSAPCPAEDRVGRCTLAPVLGTSAVYKDYSPTLDGATAEEDCAMFQDGTFEAG